VLAAAITTIVAGGVLLWRVARGANIPFDADTLCPIDEPPRAIVALLLDVSDEFTEAQQLAVFNSLAAVQQTVPQFGRIDVYAVGGSTASVIKPVFAICNPGDGATANAFYQNPAQVERRWNDFSSRLHAEIVSLTLSSGSRTSPIMEAIRATALRTFNDAQLQSVPKRLVIVSDLLQHVPGKLSQYESTTPFTTFRKTDYFSQVRANLSNVRVTVVYLVRSGAPQKWPNHRLFWEEYFAAQGASLDQIEPVFGDK
jgi:hypothetical protein